MIQYTNDDHAARNWQDAAQMVAKGEAAMNVMGIGSRETCLTNLKLKPNKDFGWSPTPDTEGTFMVITDTFGLPKGEKPRSDQGLPQGVGFRRGTGRFQSAEESIPARVDADVNKYDEYGKQTIEDFKKDRLTPSLAHGSAASEGFLTEANNIVNTFVSQGNVDQAVKSMKQAATSSGIGK